jgi:chromosomal replication initiation ATPase DnaA
MFSEFVLSGNEESLRQYYESKRQSPILESEAYVEQVRRMRMPVTREHPRYERRAVEVNPEWVINEVMRQYKVARDEIFRGTRGRENEARKVALYLVKRCSDRTLTEVAEYFGIGNNSTVSWSYRGIDTRMTKEKNSRDRIEGLANSRFDPFVPSLGQYA